MLLSYPETARFSLLHFLIGAMFRFSCRFTYSFLVSSITETLMQHRRFIHRQVDEAMNLKRRMMDGFTGNIPFNREFL
jgi:hypothetical protein